MGRGSAESTFWDCCISGLSSWSCSSPCFSAVVLRHPGRPRPTQTAVAAVAPRAPRPPRTVRETGFRWTTQSRRERDCGTTAACSSARRFTSADRRTGRTAGASAHSPEGRARRPRSGRRETLACRRNKDPARPNRRDARSARCSLGHQTRVTDVLSRVDESPLRADPLGRNGCRRRRSRSATTLSVARTDAKAQPGGFAWDEQRASRGGVVIAPPRLSPN